MTVISDLSFTAQTDITTGAKESESERARLRKREGEKEQKKDSYVSQSCDPTHPLTGYELSHFRVWSFSQHTNQSWDSTGIPHTHFIIVGGFSVHEVPQSSAGVPLNFQCFVVKQIHQVPDSPQSTHLEAYNKSVQVLLFLLTS